MKKLTSLIGILFCVLSLSFAQSVQKTSANGNLGQKGPAGGTIVYQNGNTYIECSEILGSANWANAVAFCKNYKGGGYEDWRLPTRDELEYIYEQIGNKGIKGSNDWFWSSSQRNSKYAWVERFNSGRHYGAYKSNVYLFRAVRTFSK